MDNKMELEKNTQNTVMLSHIPYLITHWGIFLNFIIFSLLVCGAHIIKYPEVISSQIIIISNDSHHKIETSKTFWAMNISSSLNEYLLENTNINIILNKYPVEQFGFLTGKIKHKEINNASGITKLIVVVESNISNIGKELKINDQEQGTGSTTIYRISFLEKLLGCVK